MKKILTILPFLALAGCVSFVGFRQPFFSENISRLSEGMAKNEVLKLMSERPEGTKLKWISPIPLKDETLSGEDAAIEILYYYTGTESWDGVITSDKMTPLVFEKEKLIGWGWDFLNSIKEEYGIKGK
ncbi:MAG: hypothetical protein COV72_02775 [Candidatus Omnitrophica bacterium CG11_big_fil_rev_8_21_14_0_20_42_13]|uniref:DUF3192 domain-containing protein n=1 Tax=Candidatus Ghiorseimicrobium undicola TaxID=1974746 RepID=A0A2H0M0P5_9BACT|nr:MAG: hypothetical protein COV72_02775 [Candidatus Omnitrophica bacterium CG11_big_fil_rev_8_21_14_0_20_42_13]